MRNFISNLKAEVKTKYTEQKYKSVEFIFVFSVTVLNNVPF